MFVYPETSIKIPLYPL